MIVVFHQAIFCDNTESINTRLTIKKTYDDTLIPRIGESIYNYMWEDNVETKVVDVNYDMDSKHCDVMLENRITDLSKEYISNLASSHGWETL